MKRTQPHRIAAELAKQIKATPPKVRVVKLGRAGWSGRYFPKSGTVMVRFGRRRCRQTTHGTTCDPDMERELLAHELSHWATRVRHCGQERVRARKTIAQQRSERAIIAAVKKSVRKRTGRAMTKQELAKLKKQLSPRRARTCKSYRGEHNAKFYSVLDKVQRFFGNSKARARTLEARAGYKPPRDYQR